MSCERLLCSAGVDLIQRLQWCACFLVIVIGFAWVAYLFFRSSAVIEALDLMKAVYVLGSIPRKAVKQAEGKSYRGCANDCSKSEAVAMHARIAEGSRMPLPMVLSSRRDV